MQFEAKVGEHGEIKIPDGVRAELQLKPDAAIKVEIAVVVSEGTGREPDWEKLNELVARLGDQMRADLLADGYSSFEGYIDDIRGR